MSEDALSPTRPKAAANDKPRHPTSSKPRPYSDQQHLNKQSKKPAQRRDTHFVCFPLVTDSSIPQLAASLEHFRKVSTLTPEIAKRRRLHQRQETPEKESADDDDAEGAEGEGAERGRDEVIDEDLKILPATAHRPPGTFHLTIGTMDLSERSEMERAIRVLKRLDLGKMRRDVEREVGLSTSRSRSRERQERAPAEQRKQGTWEEGMTEQGTVAKAAETVKETVQSLARSISPPLRSNLPSSSLLIISLEGLSAFQSPRKARVFYAPPHDPSRRLLLLANKIRAIFKAEGFVTEKRELTLHATVANMSYANTSKKGGRGGKQVRRMDVVDGRALVSVFGGKVDEYKAPGGRVPGEVRGKRRTDTDAEKENGYVWARDVIVDRVRICKMGAEKSDNAVLGMVYPAIKVEGGEVAEIVFT